MKTTAKNNSRQVVSFTLADLDLPKRTIGKLKAICANRGLAFPNGIATLLNEAATQVDFFPPKKVVLPSGVARGVAPSKATDNGKKTSVKRCRARKSK